MAENINFPTIIKRLINDTSIGFRPAYAGARADVSLTPPHISPNYTALDATDGTMELQVHPTITSNLNPEQVFESNNGILHSSFSDVPTIIIQYWITARSIILTFMQDQQEEGYNVLYFTLFLTKAA